MMTLNPNRRIPIQILTDESSNDVGHRSDNTNEFFRVVRKPLPRETPFRICVTEVARTEKNFPSLTGTLYLSDFRLVFAPDPESSDKPTIKSGNRYISELDIPLASVYKLVLPPVDARSGFTSFLNENQIRSENRSFSVFTRDFRSITFSKCSVSKSSTILGRQGISTTKMDNFIERLKEQSFFQVKHYFYPFLLLKSNSSMEKSPQTHRRYTVSEMNSDRVFEEELPDFCLSNDERIRSFLMASDWEEELEKAKENDWFVDERKFDRNQIITHDGPVVCLRRNQNQSSEDLIWHWSHTNDQFFDPQVRLPINRPRHVLLTVLGVNEVQTTADALRRAATDSNLSSYGVFLRDIHFQRFNIAKFPTNLKRLQSAYEKLIDFCLVEYDSDDERWLSKLNASKWMKYVSKALRGAASMAKLLDFRNIQLAGSDTDNSCLISSLIQILLRPECRQIKGFCELIVREWIFRGHRFLERLGHLSENSSQEGPVFLLFLDCVHQLIVQNPFAFELTDEFLLELYYSTCHCYHHTFVFNQIHDRFEANKMRPKDLLFLSAFDFSLYLTTDRCRTLRNEAANYQEITEQTNHSLAEPPNRPKSDLFEYEVIQSPQKFILNFSVDWRIVSLDFWSQCYCRYEPKPSVSIKEQEIVSEIERLRERKRQVVTKSRRSCTFDPLHPIFHANSWHPVSMDTRF